MERNLSQNLFRCYWHLFLFETRHMRIDLLTEFFSLFSHINSMLKIETEMFEKFFHRLEPKDSGAERHGSLLDLGQAPYVSYVIIYCAAILVMG